MFEKEIKFITDFSLEKLKPLGSYFTLDDILDTDIHPSVTKYISAELSYLIFEDRDKLLSSSIFDYTQPQVINLLKSVDNELKKFKSISYEDIKQLVLQAVSFNANFVVRPKWSLLKLIYNEAETKSSKELILMLDYIYFHEYLRSIIIEYIEKKKILEITKNKFEELISKIDSALIQNDVQGFIDSSLFNMLDFYSIGSKNEIKISTDYVEIFLKEKDLLDPLLKLKKTFAFGTGVSANLDEIKNILFSDKIIIDNVQTDLTQEKEDKETVEEVFINDKNEETDEKTEKQMTPEENIFTPKKNKASEKEKEDKILPPKKIIEKSEIEIEKINEKDISESNKEESVESENHTEIIDEDELSVNNELLNTENDDELLTLFDEELKTLAEETGLENDIDFNVEDDKNIFEDEEDILSEKEQKEEIKNEKEIKQPTEISEEVNSSEVLPKGKDDKIKTTNLEEEYEDNNFVEEISDEKLTASEDEVNEKEELSKETKGEKTDEPMPESQTKPQRENDIFHYLSDKEIEKIVINVFNEDQEDFVTTLEKVSECTTLEEANEIIKGVFISYRVNMYAKDASTLTSAISNYFNQ
ncbi:MAG: hypothetical protein IIB07_06830 [Bacteroidetes bacterium]|nr:hypothetical protein [Bacteroidota bacterium]